MVIGDTIVAVSEFLAPNQTVSASTFPEANFVQKTTTPEAPGSAIFQFYNFTNNYFINLGDSTRISSMGIDTSFVFFQNDTIAPLPIDFSNTWMTFERDTTGFFPAVANISIDTTVNTIDGWGTVRIPLNNGGSGTVRKAIGDFECLRLRQDVKVINQTIVGGAVI